MTKYSRLRLFDFVPHRQTDGQADIMTARVPVVVKNILMQNTVNESTHRDTDLMRIVHFQEPVYLQASYSVPSFPNDLGKHDSEIFKSPSKRYRKCRTY